MSAIITDQIRILNAKNFVAGVANTDNSYYSFIGLPNPEDYQTNWDTDPPTPKDSFDEEMGYWDSMIALKKVNNADIRQVVTKRIWKSGTKYDMYRHDYSRSNTSSISKATNLYNASYYVINEDYRVYMCLQNGTSPDYPNGQISLDQPTFTDLEPRAAGTSNDGYIWKYLYTIKPNEIIKFETSDFIPVPQEWQTSPDNAPVRENAIEGSIKIVTITNAGVNVGAISTSYTRVPINGDGNGAEATVVVNNDLKIDSVTISSQGSGYTYGTLDLAEGGVPVATTEPEFNVIIPPAGGHGADIYRELGAYNVLMYSRLENDTENPDFITGNQFSRIGVVENPLAPNSIIPLTLDKASALSALRLTGIGYSSATFTADSQFVQTIGTGLTAVGRVVSYDQTTGVLKYWQDRVGFNTVGAALTNAPYGYEQLEFTSSPSSGGNIVITPTTGSNLQIDSSFSGFSTSINNRTYNLGQDFTNGISSPEVKRYSGNIIYVDNRPSVNRSINQKEDIKVILQF
tara:strand:+ start:3812 stop:5359 length:1548 start_codon:yes stop_codon:yes gene_type:complete